MIIAQNAHRRRFLESPITFLYCGAFAVTLTSTPIFNET